MLCARVSGAAVAQSAIITPAATSAPVRTVEILMSMAFPCIRLVTHGALVWFPGRACTLVAETPETVQAGGGNRVNRGRARRFQFGMNFQQVEWIGGCRNGGDTGDTR